MHTDARARAPQRNPIMAYPPYHSLPSALLRTAQSLEPRLPGCSLSLMEGGALGGPLGSRFDRVLPVGAFPWGPLQGFDAPGVGALHDVGKNPRRSRERIPGRGDEI